MMAPVDIAVGYDYDPAGREQFRQQLFGATHENIAPARNLYGSVHLN